MKNWLLHLLQDGSAVSAIEYAILAALIAVIIIGAVASTGTQVALLYENIKDQVILALQ